MFKLLLLILFVLGLLLGSHTLIWVYVTRSFDITNPHLRGALLVALVLLALGFPVTAPLAHFVGNGFTRLVYAGAMLWLGFAIYLLMAMEIAWLVATAARLAGMAPRPAGFALGAILLAVLVTALGVHGALRPRVEEREIALPDLPESWKGARVVHLSDIHLGSIHGRGFCTWLVGRVNTLEPDLVLITGDLFDGMGGDFPAIAEPLAGIEARRGVYFTPGNHEFYNHLDSLEATIGPSPIQELVDDVVDLDGLLLAGVTFPGLAPEDRERFVERHGPALAGDRPSILLFHTPTGIDLAAEGAADQHVATYWVPDVSCTLARELGIDLQLSGHTHAGQIFPFNLVARLIYRGRHRGLHVEDGFALHVSTGTGTWGPPLRTVGGAGITVFTLR